ncbi:alpha/beta fold hydrolase, partial [Angustibacter speluncae]
MTTSTAALTTTGTTTFERDGRTVAVHVLAAGSPGARVVVLCHAAPGSGLLDPDPAETAGRDVTLVAVDRPGYGGSDPVPDGAWSTVDGAADDVDAALDRLGFGGPVGAGGWSAGGRVAA